MSKKHKLIIIPIIIIISILIWIGISRAVTQKYFSVYSLETREKSDGTGESIFCLARGKNLDGTFNQSCVVNFGGYNDGIVTNTDITGDTGIKGTTAIKYTESNTNNRTSVTDKGNAKLAYIFYKARGENINHTYSTAQNGVWKYFKTWMDYCGKKLNVSDTFKYNSTPADSSKATAVINEAEEYYQALTGQIGIKVVTKDSSEHKVGDKNYIGPFNVQTTSDFITEIIGIQGVSGYQGVATKVGGDLVDNPDYKNNFYIVINADSETNQTFTLKYRVLHIKALMELYYYSGGASSQQQIAVVNTAKGSAFLTTEFKLKNVDKDISLQKYIVETFSQDDFTDDGTALTVDNSTYNDTDRVNRYATASSVSTEEGIYKYVNSDVVKASEESKSYKTNNPVKIQPGDYVVYKITAYNNASSKLGFHIRDRIDTEGELIRSLY